MTLTPTLHPQILAMLLQALSHLHAHGRIHGDIKPANLMRMPDGTWVLIDLDNAVAFGEPIGAKDLSTAFVGPEATCQTAAGEVTFRALHRMAKVMGEAEQFEPLPAHPTYDLWSLMVVLYRAVAHKPPLDADDRDNLKSKRDLMALFNWGPKALAEALADADAALVADGVGSIERLVVCDLLGWGLQRDPTDRPQSAEEMLAHAFFVGLDGEEKE